MVRTLRYSPERVSRAIIQSGDNVLLVYSRKTQRWEFPGGRLESGEEYKDAVIREVFEETGLTLGAVLPFGAVYHDVVHKNAQRVRFVKRYFLAKVDEAKVCVPKDSNEIETVSWFSLPEVHGLEHVSLEAQEVHLKIVTRQDRPFRVTHTTMY